MFLTILGPTACGKTAVATQLAAACFQAGCGRDASCKAGVGGRGAEIISADSRQVFRGMDIGTGKDLRDYEVTVQHGGQAETLHIPCHLIDIAEPGTKYSVFEFQRDCRRALQDIAGRGRLPILCGGTGLYIESVLRGYHLEAVPVNPQLRERLEGKSLAELTQLLATYKRLHNTTDVDTARRAIRAIEIEEYYRQHGLAHDTTAEFSAQIGSGNEWDVRTYGLSVPRDVRRERISRRLRQRLEQEGMVDEVQRLLDSGVTSEALISYGLEYRYLTLYLTQQLGYDEMIRQLEIAIHQFAKRQMTYFRGMERRGVRIQWIDATQPLEAVVKEILSSLDFI